MAPKQEEHAGLPVLPFRSVAAFEKWLERNGESSSGVWLKLGKKANPRPGISYNDAVEVALCFGWIDGQVNRFDELWYLQRFTPRRPKSIWSQINVGRIERLSAEGRMRPTGLAHVEAAKADGRWDRAYAGSADMKVPDDLQAAFDAHPGTQAAFETLKRGERYTMLFHLNNAVRDETRVRRIAAIIATLTGT